MCYDVAHKYLCLAGLGEKGWIKLGYSSVY